MSLSHETATVYDPVCLLKGSQKIPLKYDVQLKSELYC
jgi:hypothetical protein